MDRDRAARKRDRAARERDWAARERDRAALHKYLQATALRGRDSIRVQQIQAAIDATGRWEEKFEWRISTVRNSTIERTEEHGQSCYRVGVANGVNANCLCPTIERAVEYLAVLEALTSELFYALGWSSWASKEKLMPDV